MIFIFRPPYNTIRTANGVSNGHPMSAGVPPADGTCLTLAEPDAPRSSDDPRPPSSLCCHAAASQPFWAPVRQGTSEDGRRGRAEASPSRTSS